MRQHNIVYGATYHGLPINASPTTPCHGEILDRTKDIMDYMVSAHSKVFFVRLDFRYPQDYTIPPGNQVFVDFLENFIQNLKRLGLDPYRFWAREQSVTERPHYHVCLFLNGNKVQSIYGLCTKAEELWQLALKPDNDDQSKGMPERLVWDCTKDRHGNPQQNGIMIRRGAPDYDVAFQDCYHWSSYLAKTRSKELIPNGTKRFGASHVPVIM